MAVCVIIFFFSIIFIQFGGDFIQLANFKLSAPSSALPQTKYKKWEENRFEPSKVTTTRTR